ncbi:heat shock cognate 71 kDa protein-like isoform X2 [Styela clava]
MPTIGIDLGTTNSCVAVFRNGRVEVIANDRGNRVTPSYVSFTMNERLVGEVAKEDESENYKNTLYQIKRLIGRTYDDPSVQADMKLWGFSVIEDNNKPKISVVHGHKRTFFHPEQVSAMVLEEMKNTAEAFLGETVTDAVITVPAYFNDAQRKATNDAGVIAGLNVIGMINEPTAAAVAYGLDREIKNQRDVLIVDLGGGTFDVTIVKIEGRKFYVRATGGDTHLGGEDFDNKLVEYFVSEFKQQHGEDISENKRALNRLRVACEGAKTKLSSSLQAKVRLEGLLGGQNFRSSISRANFNNLNRKLFERVLDIVRNTLSDSGLKKENMKEFALEDVIPLSIGIEQHDGTLHVDIPRNTKIPTKVWVTVVTVVDNQTIMTFKIYEGERTLAKDNHFLDEFTISGLPPAPRKIGNVKVLLEINACGILHVKAHELVTGNSKEITIARHKGRLSESEIKRMVQEAAKFRKKDQELKQRSVARNALEDYAYSVKVEVDQKNLTGQQRESIMSKVTEILKWMDINKTEPPEMSEIEAKKGELERLVK